MQLPTFIFEDLQIEFRASGKTTRKTALSFNVSHTDDLRAQAACHRRLTNEPGGFSGRA